MLQSKLFTYTARQAPRDEESINARLLIRAGFCDKLMAGVYSYLPLGFKVLKKIENIIRQEMNSISAQEVLMPALHPKNVWQMTDRWRYEEMFKIKSRGLKDYGLGWTHEEIVTPLVKRFVHSYKDLPVAVFQIQDKFRDEWRAKSGLLRGLEFIMKDLYSFHQDDKGLDSFYQKVKKAYFNIFKKCGIGKETFLTLSSGGNFSQYSHEFQTITSFGEDTIYLCPKCGQAVNKEIIKEQKFTCPQCQNKQLQEKKSIEVGNIFKLNDRFSKVFDFKFKDQQGQEKLVLMGCYGIGLGRLMGAVVEVHNDDQGIIWPESVAPFKFHLISIDGAKKAKTAGQKIYNDLNKENIEVLYDDRQDKSAGEKFADCDLIGIPWRVVVSEKTLKQNCVELKKRSEKKVKLIKISEIKKIK